jgi:NAD(P)-dependent dehydrogenase (short-subunit alcohol dehydrogenase family)
MGNRLETLGLSCVLVFLIGLLLLPIPPAGAQGAKFEATLSGKEQAPPIDTPAKATFVLSGSGKSLLFATAVEKYGDRDIVFANAGIATTALAGETSLATFEQVLRTNLTGVSFTIQAAAPETEQQVPRRQS